MSVSLTERVVQKGGKMDKLIDALLGKEDGDLVVHVHELGVPTAQPEPCEDAVSKEFISWLLDEIWDEEMWELNHQAFPEILCRKLAKMGYVREVGGEYERVV